MKASVLVILQLLTSSEVTAQTPSQWCEYVVRSTKDLLAHARLGDSANIGFSGGGFPSRVTLRHTGNTRAVSVARQAFLRKYFQVIDRVGLDTLFRHEVEFASADTSYWLPIQEATLADLRAEVAPGDTSTLFLLLAGSYGRPNGAHEYVFLINEFTSPKSADDWKSTLASCGH